MRDGYAEVVDPKSGVVGGVQDDYGEDTATEDQPVTPRAVSVASFVLETNTLWFWKHLVVQAHGCNVQNTGGALSVLVLFLLRSFILPKAQIPVWWSWGYLINQGLRQCYQLRCK
ncbi:hypothetical protein LWI29_035896 [Acer saccharum]|uniref:Uncharacterized protein n=1 Tax=Acer saccharum TaxID=4024 RepID=A0AA39SXU8_ACESA|nr:hypothetical protein LWI29_035896 [Acer saccharum]